MQSILILFILYLYIFHGTREVVIYYCGLFLLPLYFTIDLVFNKLTTDKIIHHLLGLGMSTCLYLNLDNEKIYFVSDLEMSTEISTFFLVLYNLTLELENYTFLTKVNYFTKLFSYVSQISFVITFFYFRIYKFWLNQHILIDTNTIKFSYLYLLTIFGIFYLNLYWATLIVKKIYKKIKIFTISSNEDLDVFCYSLYVYAFITVYTFYFINYMNYINIMTFSYILFLIIFMKPFYNQTFIFLQISMGIINIVCYKIIIQRQIDEYNNYKIYNN